MRCVEGRPPRSGGRRESGVVLAMVLILALVLSAAIFSFMRRAMVDTVVIQNRDHAAQAEALARGGVRLAVALLLEDLVREQSEEEGAFDTLDDLWARASELEITTPEGGVLELEIEDAGARLNLNALVDHSQAESELPADVDEKAENFLTDFLTKVIHEIDRAEEEVNYDPRQLALNLLDYMDPNDVGARGGPEDDYYQRQIPPYRAANRPLLSVEELRRVEGFDDALVRALRGYVTVYPLGGTSGVNLNTAPPHVLAAVYHGDASARLADEDLVREILKVREQGRILCEQSEADPQRCESLTRIRFDGGRYPPADVPARATVFSVVSQATVGDIRRRITAVIDRSQSDAPLLLSWKVR